MLRIAAVLMALVAEPSLLGQNEAARPTSDETVRLRADYARLNGRTFALHGNPELGNAFDGAPERVAAIRKGLLGLVSGAIKLSLSSPRATDDSVRDAVKAVQGDYALGAWWTIGTNTPFAHLFSVDGLQCLAVAYAILEGGEGIPDSQSFLDFYAKRNGEWNLQAVTGSEFRSSTFFVSSIPAGLAGESWFLASGFRIGDTGTRLALRLYAFDGEKVRVVWRRDGLTGGQLTISGSTIKLTYFRQYHDRDTVDEILHVTPNGLQ